MRIKSTSRVWTWSCVLVALCCLSLAASLHGAPAPYAWRAGTLAMLASGAGFLVVLLHRIYRRELRDRRLAVEAFRASETRYRELFNNVVEGVYQTSVEGQIMAANPALLSLLGLSSEDELRAVDVGRDFYVDSEQRKLLTAQLERDGYLRNVELDLLRRDGRRITVLENARAVKDAAGKVLYFEGTLNDITQRKQAERQTAKHMREVEEARRQLEQQARLLLDQSFELAEARDAALESSRLKSAFLANLSHEIRTPMNGVIGMAQLLLSTRLSSEQREFAVTAERSARLLLETIEGIVDYSKLETGQMEFATVPFSLRQVVADTIEQTSEKAEAKGIELSFLVKPDVPDELVGDPAHLRQVLAHVVDNGVKFTDWGEVSTVISVARASESEVLIRFQVEDSGVGIPAETQRCLFEAFAQAGDATHSGAGLGLAISRQMVEQMGGQIGVESEPGQGSLFWFQIRFPKAARQPAAPPLRDFTGRRVLVCDDVASVRGSLVEVLGAWGLEAHAVPDAPAAIGELQAAAARSRPYDLAILDYDVPGMTGLELAEAILDDPAIAGTRIVLLTPFSQRAWCNEPLLDGVRAMAAKPLTEQDLLRAILTSFRPESALDLARLQKSVGPAATRPWPARILVAEDNLVNRKVAERLLRKLGHTADLAGDGAEAVEAATRQPYDLILMDCQMPTMDGFQATASIRAAESGGHRPIIVAMTANALHGDRERCLSAGMDEYISKPVGLETLRSLLRRFQEKCAAAQPAAS